jgi:16S rRNA processing protein RimM
MPAHDVYVVSGDGREIMIPAVKEFILGVDLAGRTMQVQLIDGMIE